MKNLTRDEARRRAELLSVASYDVHLDLTADDGFDSTTTIRFSCREPGASTFVELDGELISATGVRTGEVVGNRIALHDLAADNVLTVRARGGYSRTGEGLHRFTDPADGQVYLWGMSFLDDAQRMFACFDQPDLKASISLTVDAAQGTTVVANARGTRDGDRWSFAATERMSTYGFTVAAGPWQSVHRPHGAVTLGVHCRQSLARHLDADELLDVTGQCLDLQERLFGRGYPFGDTYDQLFVPEFNHGAMENPGAVTFTEDFVFRSRVTEDARRKRAMVIAHEMAHMWFGDLVTMRWWDDLWLNESFATYMSVLAQASSTRWTNAWTTFVNTEKTWAYRQDQLPSTHPIAADIADIEAVKVNFDGITYAKGASVLKQLVAWVGQDAFLSALRDYFRAHEYGNTVLADLLGALERSSGRDLSEWSAEWLETAGCNTLRASIETDGDGTFTAFSVLQEAPAQWLTLRSHRVAVGCYDLVDGRLVRTHREELDVVGAKTEVPGLLGRPQPDLVLVNDDDLTFAKIRLDERSLATLTEHVGDVEESLPRALCWAALWDMTRDAELPARDYVAAVLGGIGGESDIGVVQSLLRQAQSAVTLFADPAWAPTGRAALAGAAHDALRAAEPGSDLQLAWTRAFATLAGSSEQLAVLRGLLDGSTPVDGLSVDTDLRWHLLGRLVALGEAGEADIDAELVRDSTSAGERQAATTRALRPTAEAKAAAWQRAVEDDTVPNAVQAAVIGGFWHAEQLDLLAPYVDRYFEAVGRVWQERPGELAQNVAVGLYPALLVDRSVVERTDAYLQSHEVPAPLARLLLEGRDGVVRSLRARERDTAESLDRDAR